MVKKNKKVNFVSTPCDNVKRTKQLINPQSYDSMYPSWRFSKAFADSRWSVFVSEDTVNPDVIKKIKDREHITWAEIKNSPTQKSHEISRDLLIKSAQEELASHNICEDTVFSMRLTGKARLWGIRDRGVLEILWYDPKHEICPSNKKHT